VRLAGQLRRQGVLQGWLGPRPGVCCQRAKWHLA